MQEFLSNQNSDEEESPKKPLMSRRTFLRTAGAATAVATATGFGGPSVRDMFEETLESKKLKEEIKRKVELIKSKYGISIIGTFLDSQTLKNLIKTIDEYADDQYDDASMAKIDRALDYLVQEFSKYPIFFVRSLNVLSINIVDDFVVKGNETALGETAFKKTGSKSFINLEISKGFLDKDKGFGWSEKRPFDETLHHELFHAVFNVIDESSKHVFSNAWVSLYDENDFSTEPIEGKSGFISKYAQENSDEDFAETASAIMDNGENVFEKIEKDPKLKKKVDFLKELMFQRSFGLCNQEYWDSLKKGDSSIDFLSKRKAYLLSLDFEQFKKELESNGWEESWYFTFGQEGLLEKEFPGGRFEDIREGMFQLFRKSLTEMQI